jgi:hypothetical protein
MSIRKERKAREAVQFLKKLRDNVSDQERFDKAVTALETVIKEYNAFETSLVLIHRLVNQTLDEDDRLRDEGAAIGPRMGKTIAVLADIHYTSRPENAKLGPLHPNFGALDT